MDINIFEGLFKNLKTRFNNLPRRQKFLIAILILAVLFNFYFNRLFKPRLKELFRLRSELSELNQELAVLQAEIPDLDREKASLEQFKRRNKQLKRFLANLEKELPDFYRVSQLLGYLAKQTQDLDIDFFYIKPKASSRRDFVAETNGLSEEQYARLDIEMQFNAPYYDFLTYLDKLEHISSYLNITDIVVEELKEGSFAGEATVTLVLSTLLKRDSSFLKSISSDILLTKDKLKRNPLLPSLSGTSKQSSKSKYVLSGIAFAGEASTAIINNEVYKVGDLLDKKYPIKKILQNMVIIGHGRQTEILVLE